MLRRATFCFGEGGIGVSRKYYWPCDALGRSASSQKNAFHVAKPQLFVPRSLVFSERVKLPDCDRIALDRVLLGDERTHVLDKGVCDGGRKIKRPADDQANISAPAWVNFT